MSFTFQWRRSGRCETGACVEIARIGQSFAVRDSQDPQGPALAFSPAVWDLFVQDVKAGSFDLQTH